jgi:hypothetical protein
VKVKAKDVLNGQSAAWLACPWCGCDRFDRTYDAGYLCMRCGQVTEIDYREIGVMSTLRWLWEVLDRLFG